MPTIIATIYAHCLSITYQEIKRTEPYSKLAKNQGTLAGATLLYRPLAWWHTLTGAVSQLKKEGRINWGLVCSTIAYITAILIIAPLTSSFLTTQDAFMSRGVNFTSAALGPGPLNLTATHETFLATISSLLYNITSSPWTYDGYTVFPFWPYEMSFDSFSKLDPNATTNWEAVTAVVGTLYNCIPAKSDRGPMVEKNITSMTQWFSHSPNSSHLTEFRGLVNGTSKMLTNMISLENGCRYQIDSSPSLVAHKTKVVNWGQTSGSIYEIGMPMDDQHPSSDPTAWIYFPDPQYTTSGIVEFGQTMIELLSGEKIGPNGWLIRHNRTGDCDGKDLILVESIPYHPWDFSNQYQKNGSNFTQRALMGSLEVSIAHLPVSVTAIGRTLNVSFDKSQFQQDKVQLLSTLLNVSNVLELFHASDWVPYVEQQSILAGKSATLLAAQTNGTFDGLVYDEKLAEKAERAVQQFLGQLLLLSITREGIPEATQIQGSMAMTTKRIIVIKGVGIALALLFGLNATLLIIILCTCNRTKRPLQLKHNPWTVSGAADFIVASNLDMGLWGRLWSRTHEEMALHLIGRSYGTVDFKIQECAASEIEGDSHSPHREAD